MGGDRRAGELPMGQSPAHGPGPPILVDLLVIKKYLSCGKLRVWHFCYSSCDRCPVSGCVPTPSRSKDIPELPQVEQQCLWGAAHTLPGLKHLHARVSGIVWTRGERSLSLLLMKQRSPRVFSAAAAVRAPLQGQGWGGMLGALTSGALD